MEWTMALIICMVASIEISFTASGLNLLNAFYLHEIKNLRVRYSTSLKLNAKKTGLANKIRLDD